MPNRNVTLSRKDFETLRRVHIIKGEDWSGSVGTDFWLNANSMVTPWAAGQGTLATERGWTATSIAAITAGAGADFMDSADKGTPGEFTNDGASDLLQSPSIFGDWNHAHAAAEILGHRVMPRYLVADVMARFSVNSANEATSGFGFTEDNGSVIVSADAMGHVCSNATNFTLNVNATVTASTIAVDTATHLWRIVLDKAKAQMALYIDNVLAVDFSSATAITTDEFPVSFGAGSGTTNRVQLQQAHVYYAWQTPGAGIAY